MRGSVMSQKQRPMAVRPPRLQEETRHALGLGLNPRCMPAVDLEVMAEEACGNSPMRAAAYRHDQRCAPRYSARFSLRHPRHPRQVVGRVPSRSSSNNMKDRKPCRAYLRTLSTAADYDVMLTGVRQASQISDESSDTRMLVCWFAVPRHNGTTRHRMSQMSLNPLFLRVISERKQATG